MKIISVSLWGSNPRYCEGAIINAKIANELFPDWRYRIYIGSSVPDEYFKKLKNFKNVDLYFVDESKSGYGMFWRFNVMFESDDNIVICRDSDTRLIEREKKCIDEWLKSDKKYSIIRDHPRHFDFPIIGTMWGMKGKFEIKNLTSMKLYEKTFVYGVDQDWLADVVWQEAKDDCMIHEIGNDSWFSKEREQNNPIFVGQGYYEDNKPIYPSW
jgi:hypothetical protein